MNTVASAVRLDATSPGRELRDRPTGHSSSTAARSTEDGQPIITCHQESPGRVWSTSIRSAAPTWPRRGVGRRRSRARHDVHVQLGRPVTRTPRSSRRTSRRSASPSTSSRCRPPSCTGTWPVEASLGHRLYELVRGLSRPSQHHQHAVRPRLPIQLRPLQWPRLHQAHAPCGHADRRSSPTSLRTPRRRPDQNNPPARASATAPSANSSPRRVSCQITSRSTDRPRHDLPSTLRASNVMSLLPRNAGSSTLACA